MEQKSAFIAIVGKPNVGKSSLLNSLLGEKLAIVTNKPQTTRTRIMGVLTKENSQYVFIDTPGFHKRTSRLSDNMNKIVTTSLKDVDGVILVVEPFKDLSDEEKKLIENIKTKKLKSILIINKIDLLKEKANLLKRIEQLSALHTFDSIIPISVEKNDGVSIVESELEQFAVEGFHMFDADTLTDQPERTIASEIVREKILINMHQEIPHGTAVVVEKMKERSGKKILDIDVTIFCERDSHKGMIIGKKGATLKRISTSARIDLEKFFDIQVNLQTWLKVKEDWRNKDGLIKNFGLSDFN